ncbi:MAG: cupredoxin domain-containing protein [Dehalococcoidia bacterium]
MRFAARFFVAAAAVTAGLAIGGGSGSHGLVHAQMVKDTARVVIVDGNDSFTPGNDFLGNWGFAPGHVAVHQGETIEFDNSAGNAFPHTVTSITWTGAAPDRTLVSGDTFNSSPTKADYVMPGSSWVLDTSTLDPGQYVYYCAIHPWMVGTFTVEPAS